MIHRMSVPVWVSLTCRFSTWEKMKVSDIDPCDMDPCDMDRGQAEDMRDFSLDSFRWLAVVGLFVSLFLPAEGRTVTVYGFQAFVFSLVAVVSPPPLAEGGAVLVWGGLANLTFLASCLWWGLGTRRWQWGAIGTWWLYALAVLNLLIFAFLLRGLLAGFFLWLAAHFVMLLASGWALWSRQ